MNIGDYLGQDGVGLARLIAKGEVTAREAAEAAIAVIERRNPALNAVIGMNCDRALAAAANPPPGPLSGVPFLLKDVYLYHEDLPLTWGSRWFKGARPRADSIMVRRWRDAGLLILGRTNAPEFAAEFVTEPQAYGRTVNPWDAGLTVGGSSGGAASAVAAGMVPLAHGTDLGGSIRIPAACCGLYGFKPTAGLNPCGPWFEEIAHGLNSDHVLTRSVRDSAASLEITSGQPCLASLSEAPRRLRVLATVHTAEGRIADPNQVAAVERIAEILRDLGHEVTLAEGSPLVAVGDWFDLLWIDDIPGLLAERAQETGADPGQDDLEPMTRASLARLEAAGAGALDRALRLKTETARAHLRIFEAHDILLTPTLATDPAPNGTLSFNDLGAFESWADAGYSFAPFSILANIAGQPAASLPLPLASCNIPVGVQIMAAPGRDLLILQLSHQIEQAVAWSHSCKLP
jgi:amidase